MALEILDYESPCPTFALAFSPLGPSTSAGKSAVASPNYLPDIKLAVGSFIESHADNHVTIVGLDPALGSPTTYDPYTTSHFVPLARAPHPYPVTAVSFSPVTLSESLQSNQGGNMVRTREMVATSSDCIRLWDFAQVELGDGTAGYEGNRRGVQYRLVPRSTMSNQKQGYQAPLTSFSWSTRDPSLIVTSSIDTTCTIWDISSSTAVTQLIAHDREVYDVCWNPASRDIFASVGADGSVRMFDLRSLDHSTILFEAPTSSSTSTTPSTKSVSLQNNHNGSAVVDSSTPSSTNSGSGGGPAPLLRLKFNPADPNYIAVSAANGHDVQILDVRAPGVPVLELRGHKAPVNDVAWSGDEMVLSTCSDDCQVLVWNASSAPNPPPAQTTRNSNSLTRVIKDPMAAYTAPQEVNSITWSEAHRDRLAIGLGRRVRVLRV